MSTLKALIVLFSCLAFSLFVLFVRADNNNLQNNTQTQANDQKLSAQQSNDDNKTQTQIEQIAQTIVERLSNRSSDSTQRLVGAFFDDDAKFDGALFESDCHMRNLDLCYAGILASFTKILPETEAELNSRCDEIKASSQCFIAYSARCQANRALTYLAPHASSLPRQLDIASLSKVPIEQIKELPKQIDELIDNSLLTNASLDDVWKQLETSDPALSKQLASISDFSKICDPRSLSTNKIKLIRHRIFKLAKCVNARMTVLMPCIEDLKNALQLVYDLNGKLSLKPTCCAISRFRACAMNSMDNICDLGSTIQLESSLSKGPASFMSSIGRICRGASNFESPECKSILPPVGMKAPLRRGRKASKIAKVLEMIQLTPRTNDANNNFNGETQT